MTYPRLSVVIPAHNAASTIVPCLRALANQTVHRSEYRVIVVDDGSTDGTAQAVRQFIEREEAPRDSSRAFTGSAGSTGAAAPSSRLTTLIRQPSAGPAAARNTGAQMVRDGIILFLDADCVPHRSWLERMTERFCQSDVAGVSGVLSTRQPGLIPRFVQAEFDARYERMGQASAVDFVSSGTAAYAYQAFSEAGGFDAELGGGEDMDLSFRLSESGYRLLLEPRAVVFHTHPDTLRAYALRKFHYGYWRTRVYERYPAKVVSDSRTPPSQKLQIFLAPFMLFSVLAGFAWQVMWYLAAALAAAFVLSVLAFSVRAFRRDSVVGLIAIPVTFLSAAAAGAGLFAGLVERFLASAPLTSTEQ